MITQKTVERALLVSCFGWCVLVGCAALKNVTPADRATGYATHAKGHEFACKAYKFDRAAGLVGEVPEMARVCE